MAGNAPRVVLQLSDEEQGLSVTVHDAPYGAGQTASVVLQRLEDVLRMASQPTFHQDVGRGLFRALFPGPLEEVYRAALAEATVQGVPLELELRFDRPAVRMARYPWELLHDGTRFPLQTGAVTLRRALLCPEPPPAGALRLPCELLYVAAHPADLPTLVPHYRALAEALTMPLQFGQLDLAYLLPPTWEAFMDWLLAGAPQLLHFEGHAALTRTGRLVFVGERDQADPVDVELVAAALQGTGLRLVTLGAAAHHASTDDLPAGAAPWLVLAGVPEVIALQGVLPPDEAFAFWRDFYLALLDGQPVAGALDQGRRTLRRTVYWHVPAHFVRASAPLMGSRGPLTVRLDTAAPRAATVRRPVRVALWLAETDSMPPSAEALRRLVGLRSAGWGDDEAAPVPMPCQARARGPLSAGAVEVRLAAEGCAVHTPPVRVTLSPGGDPLPMWFALTPQQAGTVTLRFTVWQAGQLLIEATHPLEVVRGEGTAAEVTLLSHHWPGTRPEPVTVRPASVAPPTEAAVPPGSVQPETPPVTSADAASTPPVAEADTFDAALDEVLAWLKTASPSPPETEPPQPAPPVAPAPLLPSAEELPQAPRRIAGLRARDALVLLLALLLTWAAIAALALFLAG
jgi:hypothetical protein